MRAARYRHASTQSLAACVVRELSAARAIASLGLRAKNNGTGASRMIEPFPADRGSVEPDCRGSVRSVPSRDYSLFRVCAARFAPCVVQRDVVAPEHTENRGE